MGNLLQPYQKHFPDLGSDASSVWNFARISKTLFRGETTDGGDSGGGGVAKCRLYSQARGLHESVKSFVIFSSSARVAKLSHTLLSLFLSKSLQLTSAVLISAYFVNAYWPLGRISRGSEPNRNGYEVSYCRGNHCHIATLMHDMHEQQGRVSVNCIVIQWYLFCVCWKLQNEVNISMHSTPSWNGWYIRTESTLLRETCVGNLATIWSEENAENVCEILWNLNQKLKQ